MRSDRVIIEPVLTEKTNGMRGGDYSKYTFKVDPRSNKMQIMQAVKELFKVNPLKCNIVTVKAKPRSSRTKSGMRAGNTTPWKKAIITLSKGETIEAIEGV